MKKYNNKPPFTSLRIDKEILHNDTLGSSWAIFKITGVGSLYLNKSTNGTWRGMSLTVNSEFRGRGFAFALLYAAWKEVGDYQTSTMFSIQGKKQMLGLVRRGWAKKLPRGDYRIHF